jgi:hypothetical protein
VSAAALERALLAAEAALGEDDAPAAAAAVAEGVRACAALEAAGVRLDGASLARLSALHARGAAAAQARRDALAGELGVAGRSRQADAAYRRHGP